MDSTTKVVKVKEIHQGYRATMGARITKQREKKEMAPPFGTFMLWDELHLDSQTLKCIPSLHQGGISGKVLLQKKSGRGLEIFGKFLGIKVVFGLRAEYVAGCSQKATPWHGCRIL